MQLPFGWYSIICLSQCGVAHALGNVNVMSNILHFSSNMTSITEGDEGGEEVNGLLQQRCIYIWNQHCHTIIRMSLSKFQDLTSIKLPDNTKSAFMKCLIG